MSGPNPGVVTFREETREEPECLLGNGRFFSLTRNKPQDHPGGGGGTHVSFSPFSRDRTVSLRVSPDHPGRNRKRTLSGWNVSTHPLSGPRRSIQCLGTKKNSLGSTLSTEGREASNALHRSTSDRISKRTRYDMSGNSSPLEGGGGLKNFFSKRKL